MPIEPKPLKDKKFCYRCNGNLLHKGKCKTSIKTKNVAAAVKWLEKRIDEIRDDQFYNMLDIGILKITLLSLIKTGFPDVWDLVEETNCHARREGE